VWRCCFHSSLLVQGCRPASRECSVHPRLTGERQHPTKALFTSQVFPPPRGLGMVEFWVNPSISPDPHISPHFPPFPPISQSILFTLNFGMGGDGRGW
jgi:hypothetical protein